MNFVQERLKAPGVPLLVTLYLFVVIGFGVVLGIPALFGNGMMETQTVGWGGRELGIAIGAIIAVVSRNAMAYLIVFVAGVFRELSDALEALAERPANTASAVMIGVLGLVGALCAWFSYRGLRENAEALVANRAV